MNVRYADGDFKVMLSLNVIIQCLSCIEQVWFDVTFGYSTPIEWNPMIDHLYKLWLRWPKRINYIGLYYGMLFMHGTSMPWCYFRIVSYEMNDKE